MDRYIYNRNIRIIIWLGGATRTRDGYSIELVVYGIK